MNDKKTYDWQFTSAPTAFSDGVNIASRSGDTLVLLQFVSYLPGHEIENFRTMMTADGVKGFMDGLAEMLDYYPEKQSAAPKAKKQKKILPVS